VLPLEHRPEVTGEPLCHAALLCQRRRVERIGHKACKLDGVVAVLRRNVEQDGQRRTVDKPLGCFPLAHGNALLPR
jgi:hypothetical protein